MSPEMQNIVTFLIPAYIAFWVLTFLYVFSIRSRQRNLERDIEALRKVVEKKQGGDSS
jgi:CcmD family protein